jgi:hypothetical protein
MAVNIDVHDLRTQLLLAAGAASGYLIVQFLLKLRVSDEHMAPSRTRLTSFTGCRALAHQILPIPAVRSTWSTVTQHLVEYQLALLLGGTEYKCV